MTELLERRAIEQLDAAVRGDGQSWYRQELACGFASALTHWERNIVAPLNRIAARWRSVPARDRDVSASRCAPAVLAALREAGVVP